MGLEVLFNPIIKATTALGVPVPLAKMYFWAAGGVSVAQNTYADAGQISANANPLVADANGLFGPVFLLPLAYRIVIKDPTDTITYFDEDNVAGFNFNLLFDSNFILKDNLDATKKMQFQLSGLTTGTTRTKTIADTSGTLLDSLYGTMGAARFQMSKGANVTAANDMVLGNDGNLFEIAGSTQINRISGTGWQNGAEVTLNFQATPTVKHNIASGGGLYGILMDGSADRAMVVSGTLKLAFNGGWVEIPKKS